MSARIPTAAEAAALPYRPCVGVVLTRGDGLVWAGERIDTPGAWQMPQGGIDRGEDPRAAALRELEEETGVPAALAAIEAETAGWIPYDVPLERIPDLWGGRFRGQEQKWLRLRFEGTDGDVDISGTGHPAEFSRWAWMAPAEVMGLIVPFKRGVYERVFEELMPEAGPVIA